MSHKWLCYDNTVMARFFLNLKMERVWWQDYANHDEAITDITHYIARFYNQVRLHSTLNYLSPNLFEQKMSDFEAIEIIKPPFEYVAKFQNEVKSIDDKIILNCEKIPLIISKSYHGIY